MVEEVGMHGKNVLVEGGDGSYRTHVFFCSSACVNAVLPLLSRKAQTMAYYLFWASIKRPIFFLSASTGFCIKPRDLDEETETKTQALLGSESEAIIFLISSDPIRALWLLREAFQLQQPSFMSDLDDQIPTAFDPFADVNAEDSGAGTKDYVHIRVQQRNGRKSLTTVQGLKKEYSYSKILKDLKKEFCCNGTVVQDPELGQVIQLQGDQRKNVSTFLVQAGIVKKEHIKIHGF
ncbi:hypothetical protein MLD38_012717 [Melastoma candidum]|uniref:Uncharacterized protein n=1 Tax=Melastoma candidum TaxID=119954 RepID=A0ACB9R779_9MYRT|nr:hypothetical protein MLD38_012717 [Melastoma candidum]